MHSRFHFVLLLVFVLCTAVSAPAQYSQSSRIESLLRSRSISTGTSARVQSPSSNTQAPAGSIAERFRDRIAAAHKDTVPAAQAAFTTPVAPAQPSPRPVMPSRIQRELAARRAARESEPRAVRQAAAAGRAGGTSFFSNIERLRRQRKARARGEMPYTTPQPTAAPGHRTLPVRRAQSTATARPAPSGDRVRARLAALRRQGGSTLRGVPRALTKNEKEKLDNWLRKNKFRSIHTPRRDGETPLHRAVFQGNKDMAVALLSRGADVNAEMRFNTTSLHQAAARGQGDMVQLLLSWRADPNVRDSKGETALQKAARAGHHPIVRQLLSTAADLNARCDAGCTPLIEAAGQGHLPIVKTLVEAGADVNVRCDDNETAVQKAAAAGHNEIARFLLTKM